MIFMYVKVFLAGGLICAAAQILIDKTKITPARLLVSLVGAGILLSAFGFAEPAVKFAGAGITSPITGFGITLAKGVSEAVKEKGLLGALTGGLTAVSSGIAGVVVFAFTATLISSPKEK